MASGKLTITSPRQKKKKGEKTTMLTAYDYPFAALLDAAGIDMILVGDSAANVVLGYPDTIPITMDELIVLTRAVSRAVKRALVIGDMPFGSTNASIEDAIRNATRFMKEGGTDAVKLEGGGSVVRTVEALVKAGIPTVGHLGLTPQTAGMMGGYRLQARTAEAAAELIRDALKLQDAGAFLLVVECIPSGVTEVLTKKVDIPVIGIGAGPACDGQVLVLHDMLGIKSGYDPKFVKKYACLGEDILKALTTYRQEVESGAFPTPDHSFAAEDEEIEKLKKLL
ncbi:MAG: 3-methyl-2-oxobutanoate hydroxymethyltransferase [Pseudomonadota bacterium]